MNPNKEFKKKKRRRGRPTGWVMPQKVKNKIAKSKMNGGHSVKTRNKISESLRKYFRGQEKVSLEMLQVYQQQEIRVWIKRNADKIDGDIIRTEKHIVGINKTEIQVGDTVDFYGHGFTALDILLSFEAHQVTAIMDYRHYHLSRKKSGKDYCNII